MVFYACWFAALWVIQLVLTVMAVRWWRQSTARWVRHSQDQRAWWSAQLRARDPWLS